MKKPYLGEREFLYAISVRFMKRFEDISSVDTNTKDVFMFKLDSGHTLAVNCKFDDLYSDYKNGLSIDTIFEKMLKCMNAEKLEGKFIEAFASVSKKDNILKNVKLCPVDAKKIIMGDISKKVNDDYWIFPSSTEEFIVVPKSMLNVSDKEDIAALADIVRQANVEADVIKDGVFLSDNLYQYDRGRGFSIAEGNDYEQDNDIELD